MKCGHGIMTSWNSLLTDFEYLIKIGLGGRATTTTTRKLATSGSFFALFHRVPLFNRTAGSIAGRDEGNCPQIENNSEENSIFTSRHHPMPFTKDHGIPSGCWRWWSPLRLVITVKHRTHLSIQQPVPLASRR